MLNISGCGEELLSIFYLNADREFYMNEIGRMLGKKPGVFQRAINKLAVEGILASEYRANVRYFKANKAYPLYKELSGLVLKQSGVKQELSRVLEKYPEIKVGFIYGSFARGKEKSHSDIDLFFAGKADENKLLSSIELLEKKFGRELNYKILSEKQLKEEVKDKDPFILSLLSDNKIFLKGGEYELREVLKGKPDKKGAS